MSRTTTVRRLGAGQVMSMADTQLEPSVIGAISNPVGGSRLIKLTDLLGEPIAETLMLGLDRRVQVHEATAWHHWYTNETDRTLEVRLGPRIEVAEPGDTLHYTGAPMPERFDEGSWSLVSRPVEIAQEPRPL